MSDELSVSQTVPTVTKLVCDSGESVGDSIYCLLEFRV